MKPNYLFSLEKFVKLSLDGQERQTAVWPPGGKVAMAVHPPEGEKYPSKVPFKGW